MASLNKANQEDKSKPVIPDTDALIDEIIAKKGKFKYTDGMSEDNWEEASERPDG